MALSYIWVSFFCLGCIGAFYQFFFLHKEDIFRILVNGMFDAAQTGVQISISLVGVLAFFLGLMHIATKAGIIGRLSSFVSPFLSKLFPSIPAKDEAMGSMMMNFSANLLGLDNAATPFGLQAMKGLQKHNHIQDTASDSQILFVVMHASGLTLIPLSIIAQRVALGSSQATSIFIPCMLATYFTTIAAIVLVGIKQKLNLLHPLVLTVLLGFTLILVALLLWIPQATLLRASTLGSHLLVLGLVLSVLIVGIHKKINVFQEFIEGAKQGFDTSIKLIAYLVAMLVAISVLRYSGVLDLLVHLLGWLFHFLPIHTDFVAALPTALMKPISGAGARALMIDSMKTYGVDSFVGQLSCVLQGSSDTTFYIIAVYFGIVQIKNIRYTLSLCLLADLIGIVCAILLSYLFFH